MDHFLKSLTVLFCVCLLYNEAKEQSPCLYLASADINSTNAIAAPSKSPIIVTVGFFDKVIFKNTGSVFEILDGDLNTKETIYGDILGKNIYKFNAARMYFNSSTGNVGSTLVGVGAPIMIDVFFYNTKYTCIEQALPKPDGIVIFRTFLFVGEPYNPLFTPLEKTLKYIENPGSSVRVRNLNKICFYTSVTNSCQYYRYRGLYRYNGGLTNYGIVFVAPLLYSRYISFEQFAVLKRLKSWNGQPLVSEIKNFKQENVDATRVQGSLQIIKVLGN